MIQDRIQFVNSLELNDGLAKEISIKHYFDELMAFYDLISLDPNREDGVKNFWFENDHNFAMNIQFSQNENLQSFCEKLSLFDGTVFIYGLYYRLHYKSKRNLCTVQLSVLLDDEDPRSSIS
ncbi:MAG: hypothetical protein PHC62_00625 [Candidatus Izemoplasmatales bacterium]|nr:hypothetical protein [Candidatus Izemoplasmatales bacterium]